MKLNETEIFLVKCAGGDTDILDQDKIPIEYNKLVGIGAAVLLTGLYATFSMSYAISWIFVDNSKAVILVSIFWGLAIFNLDRLIVGTTYKKRSFQGNDLFQLIIRTLLTIVISFTISVPLEIKFFEVELQNRIKQEKIEATNENIDLINLEKEYQRRIKNLDDEVDGRGPSKQAGFATKSKYKKEERDRAEKKFEEEKAKIRREAEEENFGFLSLYTALERYKASDKDVRNISYAITALLLLFELTPVLIKFTLPRGVYDEQIEAMEVTARISIRKRLEEYITNNPLKNTPIPNFATNPNSQPKEDESLGETIGNFFKGKMLDIAFAILLGLVLALLTNNYIYAPTIGAVISFIINSYFLPKNS